jgi:ubiquitin-conjugating enzyme E2 J2
MDKSVLATKRLAADYKLIMENPEPFMHAYPTESNVLEWNFLLIGPESTIYDGGHYLGRLVHDKEYPFKPPNFYFLTPSGRFIVGEKICFSVSAFHEKEWLPVWNTKALLMGILSLFAATDVDSRTGVGHETRVDDETKLILAYESVQYNKTNHPEIYAGFDEYLSKRLG